MLYVYDLDLEDYPERITRYGVSYKLEHRTRMGNQLFFTYKNPDKETILVIPRFAQQFREVERTYRKFATCKKLETAVLNIRKSLNKDITIEEQPYENDEMMTLITVDYKDIRVEFEFIRDCVKLRRDFEIVEHNIFGNGLVITMELEGNNRARTATEDGQNTTTKRKSIAEKAKDAKRKSRSTQSKVSVAKNKTSTTKDI